MVEVAVPDPRGRHGEHCAEAPQAAPAVALTALADVRDTDVENRAGRDTGKLVERVDVPRAASLRVVRRLVHRKSPSFGLKVGAAAADDVFDAGRSGGALCSWSLPALRRRGYCR